MQERIKLFDCLEWTGGTTSVNDHVTRALNKAGYSWQYDMPGVISVLLGGERRTLECLTETEGESTFITVYAVKED